MSKTVQQHSLKHIQEENIDYSFTCYEAVKEAKADARDNLQIVNSLSDSINNLCSSLERLDAFMENLIFFKEKGEKK